MFILDASTQASFLTVFVSNRSNISSWVSLIFVWNFSESQGIAVLEVGGHPVSLNWVSHLKGYLKGNKTPLRGILINHDDFWHAGDESFMKIMMKLQQRSRF